mgnify:CR=1 FL=1
MGQRLMAELTYRSWPLPAIEPLSHEEEVHYAEFSPDGRRILTASLDNAVQLWDVETGRRLGTPLRHNLAVIERQGRNKFLKGLKPILARFSPEAVVSAGFSSVMRSAGTPCATRASRTAMARFFASSAFSAAEPVAS